MTESAKLLRFKRINSDELCVNVENNQLDMLDQADDFELEMADHAMGNIVPKGATLLVDPLADIKHNDLVVVEHNGQEICRRIFISKRKCWLYCEDKSFPFIEVDENMHGHVLGVVKTHYVKHDLADHDLQSAEILQLA